MRQNRFAVLAVLFCSAGSVFAQDQVAKSRIVSAGVFKNGLTFIKSEVTVPGAGTYRFENAPEPVHGTFWIESNCKVESAVTMREVDIPVAVGSQGSLQEDLAGKTVTIHFKDGKTPDTKGTVAKTLKVNPNFLILKTAKGHAYVNPAEIASVDVEGKDAVVKQRKPALVLTVGKSDLKPTIFVTYVTRGLGWAPSYLVDITDPKKLSIEMSAVLRNDLAKLEDADVKLISGSSSVQFAHVPSLLSPITFDKFLTALTTRRDDTSLYNRNVSQNPDGASNTISWAVPNRLLMGALPDGEGVDLHFQSIGKRSLGEGEAQSLSVEKKEKVDYERIVEWHVTSGARTEGSVDDIWDVLHFKNPFTFPITAGPALVMEKGQFNGQRALHWSNVGEETSLRITRSLSVRTFAHEREDGKKDKDKIETIKIGNATYQLVTVQGELIVNNHRKQAIKMLVRRTVNGKILSTEGDPKKQPREEGLSAINPSHDLLWTLNLASGEEKTLRYRYSFLVGEGRAHW